MGKDKGYILWIVIGILILYGITEGIVRSILDSYNENSIEYAMTFKIISSEENKELDNVIKTYARKHNYTIDIDYADTLDIMSKLNNGEEYDAVWVSNSIWLYMIDQSKTSISQSKSTSINPVVFGIPESKAKELGFDKKDVYTKDIINAISSDKLKFSMSNPVSTNSGASAYLGILSVLAGNPEVLTEDMLNNQDLKNKMKDFFGGLERSSGSEDFLEEMYLKGDYEAVVTYESSIININKKLAKNNKETLYAIYPVDGVSISDSPFAYIDHKKESKRKIFENMQKYILSNEGQNELEKHGRRTWYGGVTKNAPKNVFNPDWGIDTSKYITPVKYPSTEVIKKALSMYQIELRKPIHVVFALDYSGSMDGSGIKDLRKAMRYILTDEASKDLLQFSEKDKIDVVPFNSEVKEVWSTNNGTQTEEILKKIDEFYPTGLTALYPAASKGLDLLKDENKDIYNTSVILMTDGEGNVGSFKKLEKKYKEINKDIPIYSITFGYASEAQLHDIAALTNGKVFDGKTNLVEAFKKVRGYN